MGVGEVGAEAGAGVGGSTIVDLAGGGGDGGGRGCDG